MSAASSDFGFDHARHRVAGELKPELIEDFQRLLKILRHGPTVQLLIAEFGDSTVRDTLIQRIDAVTAGIPLKSIRLDLSEPLHPDFASVEAALARLATDHHIIHVTGGDTWFTGKRWDAFNVRREAVTQAAPARLILWLGEAQIHDLATRAVDLWAWRSGVFRFLPKPQGDRETLRPVQGPIDNRSMAERGKRIAALRSFLRSEPPPVEELALPLWDELADLLASIGDLDEALRIRSEVQLPVFQQLGDVRSAAVTHGKIANILEARGQFDEALSVRTKVQLPVYLQLGDAREAAVAQGKIADILNARGQFDEALRILTDEVLPVFQQLGDVRSAAVTHGQIANILEARGQFDEALRIRSDVILKLFEHLGDVREAAVTQGQIADILQARGQFDEALRIRSEVELPVYRKLGDVREASVALFKIAKMEVELERTPAAFEHLAEAYGIAERMRIPDGLAAVGEFYGQFLLKAGERDRGLAVLSSAETAARQLGWEDEAERIAAKLEALRQMPAAE